MKSSIFKIVIALIVAALAGGGYFVYAQPPEGTTVYIAGQNITKGHMVEANMVRKMTVRSDTNVPVVDIQNMIGKKAASNIQKGEWITPALVTDESQTNMKYYAITLPKVKAGGPLLKAGAEVDVWANAGDTTQSHKVLSNTLISQVKETDGNAVVVLALEEDDVSTVSTAHQRSGVFFTIGSSS